MALESGKVYQIINLKSGTVLDVDAYNGYNVIGWQARDKGGNQHWKLEKVGDHWTFFNGSLKRYLGTAKGELANSHPVFAREETPIFKWDVKQKDGNEFRISVPNAKFNLDLSNNGSASNGTYVILWEHRDDGDNQVWKFVEVPV